jgi:protocatechuate 3,4-dioxygenase beta subunit
MSPAMTEGPFFVEEKLNRSDLVMGETDEAITAALPLLLTLGVYSVSGSTCKPVSGLQVDIWHANALGVYSDVRSGAIQSLDTQGKKFLRAYQITDEAGLVRFATIYPGWYPSRTIHIHVKVRMPMGGNTAYDYTSQIFFDESISSMVLSQAPYSKTMGTRMIFNDDDHIYNGTAANGQKPAAGKTPPGKELTAALTKMGSGYAAVVKLGIKV